MSSLHFPSESTSHLYEKINNHFIKVFIPNCSPIQTNCSRKSWQKLMKLQCTVPGQKYYLAAKHTISKCGRKLVISSPLQVTTNLENLITTKLICFLTDQERNLFCIKRVISAFSFTAIKFRTSG